ncbi:MAG: hypothetical protein ACK4NN_16935, partial [Rheinheimera sp.]
SERFDGSEPRVTPSPFLWYLILFATSMWLTPSGPAKAVQHCSCNVVAKQKKDTRLRRNASKTNSEWQSEKQSPICHRR